MDDYSQDLKYFSKKSLLTSDSDFPNSWVLFTFVTNSFIKILVDLSSIV